MIILAALTIMEASAREDGNIVKPIKFSYFEPMSFEYANAKDGFSSPNQACHAAAVTATDYMKKMDPGHGSIIWEYTGKYVPEMNMPSKPESDIGYYYEKSPMYHHGTCEFKVTISTQDGVSIQQASTGVDLLVHCPVKHSTDFNGEYFNCVYDNRPPIKMSPPDQAKLDEAQHLVREGRKQSLESLINSFSKSN